MQVVLMMVCDLQAEVPLGLGHQKGGRNVCMSLLGGCQLCKVTLGQAGTLMFRIVMMLRMQSLQQTWKMETTMTI